MVVFPPKTMPEFRIFSSTSCLSASLGSQFGRLEHSTQLSRQVSLPTHNEAGQIKDKRSLALGRLQMSHLHRAVLLHNSEGPAGSLINLIIE